LNKSFLCIGKICACSYILLLATGPAFGAAITSTWKGPNGNWSVPSNWTNGVPNNGGGNTFTAVLNNGSSVHMSSVATINNLTIDSVDSLALDNDDGLTINSGAGAGSISNNGTITVNATDFTSGLYLTGGGTVTLSGNGMVTMGNNFNNHIYSPNVATALVIGPNQLVQGAGQIGLGQTTVTNNGTITANQSAGMGLAANATGFTNNGTIQTSGAGSLILTGGPFTNTSGAILLGAGTTATVSAVVNGGPITLSANSTLNLSSGRILGGTLTNSSTGNIVVVSFGDLSGTVNNVAGGQIAVDDGAALQLDSSGTFTNNGNIALNASGTLAELSLIGGGTVTLGGSGTLTMGNNVNNLIFGTTALVIGPNQLVQGAGQIGLSNTTITNNGTIRANQTAGLTLSPSRDVGFGFTNNGTIQTAGSGSLTLSGGTFTNTSGMILLAAGTTGTVSQGTGINGGAVTLSGNSTLNLFGATIHGGTLTNSSTGNIVVASSSTLGGIVNNIVGGQIAVSNGAILSLESSGTFTNNGNIALNSTGGFTDLELSGGSAVTLAGTGTLTMDNNVNNRVYGGYSTALVIGPNQLVQGAGQVGLGQTTIINNGTITANQPAGMVIEAGGFTNNGMLNAKNNSTLEIDYELSLGNNSSLAADGGKLRLNIISGSTSVGSGVTANITGSGILELAGSVSALGTTISAHRVAITNNSAAPGILVSGTSQVVGGIDGSGTTQVNAGSDLTANHIVQSALVIGGTASSPAIVTIDASDSSGDPLSQPSAESSNLSFAGLVAPSEPIGSGTENSERMLLAVSASAVSDLQANGTTLGGADLSGSGSAVPEPSTLLLFALGSLSCAAALRRRAR
jgi:hypothetical protein